MPLHWTHDCPPDAQIWTELVTDEAGAQIIRVSCDAPGDPREPDPPPDTTGTADGTIGDDHFYSLDWEFADGPDGTSTLIIHDFDITLSLDDEIR